MDKGYYVYLHYNIRDEIIYVGSTTNIKYRMTTHKSKSSHYKDVASYSYSKVDSKKIMLIYEQYYINKYKPIYNKNGINNGLDNLKIKELEFRYSNDALEFYTKRLERIRFRLLTNYLADLKRYIGVTDKEINIINEYKLTI